MPDYQDMYMRDFPGDTGSIPSTTRVAVSYSPDIIPAGTQAVQNYQSVYTANYNGPYNYYQNIQQNLYNYIYVRGYNLFPGAQTGTIALYYAPSSLLLMPDTWINNKISNVNGGYVANVSASAVNQIAVGDAPFYWQPAPLPPEQGHYCLISQVVTQQNPNPIPSNDNLGDFAQWVANHPGIAWRNVTVVTTLPGPTFSGFQGFANTESKPNLITLVATCINIPDNTSVSLVCAKSGPVPVINTTQTVGPANQTSTNPKTNVISTVSTLPANFSAQVQLSATLPNGVQPPPGARITVSYYVNVSNTDRNADIGFDPAMFNLTSEQIGFPEGGVMLLLGDYTYEFELSSVLPEPVEGETTSQQLPRFQSGMGRIQAGGNVSFGNGLSLSFDGNHSFSLGGWFRLGDLQPNGYIFQKANEFYCGVQNGVPYAQFANQISPLVSNTALDQDWHYLTLTFATNNAKGGTLTFFIDGAQTGQAIVNNVGMSNQGQPLLLGGSLNLDVWCFCVYTAALTPSQCGCNWQPDMTLPGQIASYCFMQAPPRDTSGNNNPISFIRPAAEKIATPGTDFSGVAYALPATQDGVNPGGQAQTPYTIQSWIYPRLGSNPQSAYPQVIFSNGPIDGACVALSLGYNSTAHALTLNAICGNVPFSVTSSALTWNAWHNVALTYDGRSVATLYVDGQSIGSQTVSSPSLVARPNLVIGAAAQNAAPTLIDFFQGTIQTVDVWNTCLAGNDIQTYMISQPDTAAGCLAAYTLTELQQNGVTTSPIGLYNGAAVVEMAIDPPAGIEALYARAPRVKHHHPRRHERKAPAFAATHLSERRMARVIENFADYLPDFLDDDTRQNALDTLAAGLEAANGRIAATGRPLPGRCFHVLEGNEYVFYVTTVEGAEECLRMPVDLDNPETSCLAWYIDLGATLFVGVLTILGVPLSSGRVASAIGRFLTRYPGLGQAMAATLLEEVTVRSIVGVIKLFFIFGSVKSLMLDILDNLHWWEILFVVAGVLFQLFEIVFPNPSTAAWVAVKLALLGSTIAQLVAVVLDKPSGC